MALQLGLRADRRWALTGTPRSYQLLDVWGPANFVTRNGAFPPFLSWRGAHFYPADIYGRIWKPKPGVEDAIIAGCATSPWWSTGPRWRPGRRWSRFTIRSRCRRTPRRPTARWTNGTTADFAKLMAKGITPPADIAVVGKLMQVCSGAIYTGDEDDAGARSWKVLHERRLDVLADIHEGHDRPTLVFVTFRHEIARIIERFPFAARAARRPDRCLERRQDRDAGRASGLGRAWRQPAVRQRHAGVVHLPWSAELFTQANARLVRQGQRDTVTVHIITSPGPHR